MTGPTAATGAAPPAPRPLVDRELRLALALTEATFADRAFRANSKGELKMSEVLDLLRYEIDDEEWVQAMQAIRDSIQAIGNAVYVRVYERIGQSEKYRPVTLDLAAV